MEDNHRKPSLARKVFRRGRAGVKSAVTTVRSSFSKVNPEPIFILGNQRSGTTAIAALLSQCTGKSASLDIARDINSRIARHLAEGKVSFDDYIARFKLEFSREIIKEPGLTIYYDDLKQRFPRSRYVMIMRDPRTNIRSILNRHKIDGHEVSVEPYWDRLGESWQRVFDSRWAGVPTGNMIESLAHRWNHIAEIYLSHREEFELVLYEDFSRDKAKYITDLAVKLGLEARHNIRDKVDVQYQIKGNRSISMEDFFGTENLGVIERICRENMEKFGYK